MTPALQSIANLLWFATGFIAILAVGVAGALVAMLYLRKGGE